jgi:hypothetical protein
VQGRTAGGRAIFKSFSENKPLYSVLKEKSKQSIKNDEKSALIKFNEYYRRSWFR